MQSGPSAQKCTERMRWTERTSENALGPPLSYALARPCGRPGRLGAPRGPEGRRLGRAGVVAVLEQCRTPNHMLVPCSDAVCTVSHIVPDEIHPQVHLNEGFQEVELGELDAGL